MKTLKPATIIPPELYVERAADRQLRRVLEDMGRPGYVLVARQMGKTNLLLHAKRELESESTVFSYLDLSGAYRSARECFRAIVDTTIETHPAAFPGMAERLAAERLRRDLPPHKEHEFELRTLLSAISGKLVIVLDEIDALTRCDHSDQIFSQIRSIYFARVNFPEYARLTYVLSGVAEPADIIKNPNLSPFNIGEKIYLDEFDEAEFRAFTTKARLAFSEGVFARVFFWAGGNPRISWDLCAELEDCHLSGLAISPETVDQCVSKLYLTAFDKAPVDHIRTLVESDKLIRHAVVQIRYGKGETLSDAVRSRLFLAGIIKANARNVAIKNRIVDAALSDQWLKDVEVRKSGALSTALSAITEKRYQDAVSMLGEYLASGSADPHATRTAHYYLGLARLKKREYAEAITEIEAGLYDKGAYSADYIEQVYQLGLCHVYAGNLDAARARFEEVVEGDSSGDYSLRAMLPLASIYFSLDFEKYRERVFGYNLRIISEAESHAAGLGRETVLQLLAAARVSQAKCLKREGDVSGALALLKEAAANALLDERPGIILEQYKAEPDAKNRSALLAAAADAVIGLGLDVKPHVAESSLAFDDDALALLLAAAHAEGQRDVFDRVIAHVASKSSNPARRRAEVLHSLAERALLDGNLSGCRYFISQAWVDIPKGSSSETTLGSVSKLFAWLNDDSDDAFTQYLRRFKSPEAPPQLDWMDLGLITKHVQRLQAAGSHEAALTALHFALERHESNPPAYGVVLQFLAMRSHGALKDATRQREAAVGVLRLAPTVRREPPGQRFLDPKNLKHIISSAEGVLRIVVPQSARVSRKIGRNDWVKVRFPDGRVETVKYKKVEVSLEEGRCDLVD
jgi:tetratricopeptide (TPR) repeat protein